MERRHPEREINVHALLERSSNVKEQEQAAAERQRLEARYQRVVDHIRDALLMDDVDGNVVFANRAFLDLFGLERADLDGLVLEDYVAPEWRDRLRDRHDRRVRGEEVPSMFEYVGMRKDGTRMDIEVSVVEIIEDGVLVGTQSVIRDITERKAMERRTSHARRMEALGQLAGGVAHDFNNILTALLHYPERIAEALPADSEAHESLRQITKAVDRATAITRQLLTFSRKQAIQPRPISVDHTLRDLLPMLRRIIGRPIELDYRCDAPTGPVLTDPSQIEQIVLNLVVNARDAMPSGGSIHIEVAPVTLETAQAQAYELSPGDHVRIRVSDQGEGIPEHLRSRLFAPFFTTKPEGTGLGLATVLAAVQRASGHIEVDSEIGRGTAFTVWLPVTDREPVPKPRAVKAGAQVPAGTVLLVEDSVLPRRVLKMMLEKLGQSVLVAEDGVEGLAILKESRSNIDLMISDIVMPKVNGMELAREAIAIQPGLPILLISGYAPGELPGELEALNIPVLGKPFTLSALSNKLVEILR